MNCIAIRANQKSPEAARLTQTSEATTGIIDMTRLHRRQALRLIAGATGATLATPAIIRAQTPSELKIGGMLPLSGPAAIEGHQVLKGLEFAVKEANAAGGALDREIVLMVEDDEANTTRGVIAVRKLIETDKVPFIVGTYASAVVIATMQITKEYGVPLLSGGSTSVAATDANEPGNPWFFRSWPSSVDQGLDTANAITGRFGAKTVAIIHDSGSYGYSLGDQVEQVVKDNGGEILSRDTYNAGEQDFTTLLTRIRSEKPGAVYIGGWAGDGAMIVRQATEVGLRTQFVGSGSMVSDDFIELAGPASEGFAVATLYEPSTPNVYGAEFGKRFEAEVGQAAGTLNSLGFDSTSIGIEAVRRTGGTDSKAVRDMIATGMADFPIVQGPEGATAAFDAKGSVDFPNFIAVIKDGVRTLA